MNQEIRDIGVAYLEKALLDGTPRVIITCAIGLRADSYVLFGEIPEGNGRKYTIYAYALLTGSDFARIKSLYRQMGENN